MPSFKKDLSLNMTEYCNSPKYSDTLNFQTPLIIYQNNRVFVHNFGHVVKYLSLNFLTQNYDGLEVQRRPAVLYQTAN